MSAPSIQLLSQMRMAIACKEARTQPRPTPDLKTLEPPLISFHALAAKIS